jgi:hypothetical protein
MFDQAFDFISGKITGDLGVSKNGVLGGSYH